MSKWDKIDSLNEVQSIDYSFLINKEFSNSVASTSVQAISLIAYGSGKNVVVLINGIRLVGVLRGHESRVCTVAFENQGYNIYSFDEEGTAIFWRCQENKWEISRIVKQNIPTTCASVYQRRRNIAFTNEKGLFISTLNDFGTSSKLLTKKASFCEFDSTGTMLAAHDFGKFVLIFDAKNSTPYVLRHPTNVLSFSFHPTTNLCLTYGKDGILRIWKKFQTFSCTALLQTNSHCSFIHTPHFIGEKVVDKSIEIASFINEKLHILKVSEKGKFISGKLPKTPQKIEERLVGVYKTDSGRLAFVISNSCLKIISGDSQNSSFTFHQKKIIENKFLKSHLFTRDESGCLIVWSASNISEPVIIAFDAGPTTWFNNKTISFIRNGKIMEHLISENTEKEVDFEMDNNSDVLELTVINDEYFVVCKDKIISKNKTFKADIRNFAFSKEYCGTKTFIYSNGKDINAISLPAFEEIEIDQRPLTNDIISIKAGNINSFVVLSRKTLEFWNFTDSKFTCTKYLEDIPLFNGVFYDAGNTCGRVLCFNDKEITAFHNSAERIYSSEGIDDVNVNDYGTSVVIKGESFTLFPTFCLANFDEKNRNNETTDFIRSCNDDKTFALHVSDASLGYIVSPTYLFPLKSDLTRITQLTLMHLLEFSLMYNLDNCVPMQVPAFPNQQVIPSCFELPENASLEHKKILKIANEIRQNEDLDMFAVRFLLAYRITPIPPDFFGLYFSFSVSQSQIIASLKENVTVYDLSKLFISACVKSQVLLEEFVLTACNNTWKDSKNAEYVALYYVALGNQATVAKLYKSSNEAQKAEFFKKDFTTPRNKKSASKNAYSSLSKHTYDMAAALFLLADDVKSAISTICDKMNDPLLALLVLRLKYKLMDHPVIKEFLGTVKWSSDLIQCMIANQIGSKETAKILEKTLFTERTNLLQFGDWRIPIFEVLFSITRKATNMYALIFDILTDGLAPLAFYIYEYCQNKFDTFHAVENNSEASESSSEEEEESIFKVGKLEIESDSDDVAFDFGGGGAVNDFDDWSDDESYSDDNPEEEENNNKEEEEEKVAEVKEETKNEVVERRETEFEKLVHQKFFDAIDATNCLFSDTKTNIKCGLDAIHFYSYGLGFKNFPDDKKYKLTFFLSKFIEYCGSRFLCSSPMPLTPKRLATISEYLYKMIMYNDPFSSEPIFVSLTNFMKIDKEEIKSVFLGLFIVSLWTFNHELLASLLSDKEIKFSLDSITNPKSSLDADLSIPLFADSIPTLLKKYCMKSPDVSIDMLRLLVLWLIFKKVVGFCPFLEKRFSMFTKHLQLFQAATAAPIVGIPELSPDEVVDDLTSIIINIHSEFKMEAMILQSESHQQQKENGIFKNGMLYSSYQTNLPDLQKPVINMARSNLHSSSVVIQTEEKVFYMTIDNKTTIREIAGITPKEASEIISIECHPEFDVFIAVLPHNAMIFDDSQVAESNFVFLNRSQINCAAFSPNGTKVAFGTTSLDIVSINISAEEQNLTYTKRFDKHINAIAWINSETTLAVALKDSLRIISTIFDEQYIIPYPKEWGEVTTLAINQQRTVLVFGLSNGMVVVADVIMNYNIICVFDLSDQINCISVFGDLFAVGTESGKITLFSAVSPKQHQSLQAPSAVSSIALGNNWILVATRESSEVLMWHV